MLELANMERIMMTLFPFNMRLNPRVGPEQLAERIAGVFGLDYRTEKSQSEQIASRPLFLSNSLNSQRGGDHKVKVLIEMFSNFQTKSSFYS